MRTSRFLSDSALRKLGLALIVLCVFGSLVSDLFLTSTSLTPAWLTIGLAGITALAWRDVRGHGRRALWTHIALGTTVWLTVALIYAVHIA